MFVRESISSSTSTLEVLTKRGVSRRRPPTSFWPTLLSRAIVWRSTGDEIRCRCFSRFQLRPRRVLRGEGCPRPGRGDDLAQGHEPRGRRCCHPAWWLRAWRLPEDRRDRAFLTHHADGEGIRRCRGPRARHLQRLPGVA